MLNFSIVIAIVLNFYTNNIRQAVWTFRETNGLFHETRYITVVTSILNIILSIVGGLFGGMFGIILATVISRMLYAWWKEPVILFDRCFDVSPKVYCFSYIKNVLVCVFACFVTYGMCRMIPIGDEMIRFIMKILICCLVPNLIFVFFYVKTSEFKYIWEKIIRPLVKNTNQ